MNNFGKKWFISASSGILGKIVLVLLCFGAGVVGGNFISVPIDKDIIIGAGSFIGFIAVFFAFISPYILAMILEWLSDRRESENENLQLENENLKLKLELQEKQSQPDNDA
ncbi:MAG: hypothetical protein OXC79_10790 [Candidatus Poribacteria bacterium]|nr:hypothetical protein [Candidatus Poribacteria bacterium]